jgi:hypothetical protein
VKTNAQSIAQNKQTNPTRTYSTPKKQNKRGTRSTKQPHPQTQSKQPTEEKTKNTSSNRTDRHKPNTKAQLRDSVMTQEKQEPIYHYHSHKGHDEHKWMNYKLLI